MPDNGWPADRIDTESAHSARIYDYILGGKDYYPADKEAGDAMAREWPALPIHMRANRDWMNRAVRWLAEEAGIRQFLDIGTGIPTSPNLHEIAQSVAPASRVVYVDNDPIVMMHAQALLVGDPRGVTSYLEADVRDPGAILQRPELRETLDLDRPVGLLLVALLHFVHDDEQVEGIVRELVGALAPGSHVVLSHGTMDLSDAEGIAAYEQMFAAGGTDVRARSRATLERWLAGLEILEPGIVPVADWRPDDPDAPRPVSRDLGIYGVVARKP